jgi:hypothetical protein
MNISMNLDTTEMLFPYGTFSVSEETQQRYSAFRQPDTYPFTKELPQELPLHHPLLQRLEGHFPVCDMLPPWWHDFVAQEPMVLQPLLRMLSIREFRMGCFDEQRWRDWKQDPALVDHLPRRPRLDAFFDSSRAFPVPWHTWLEDRGAKDTPEELDLVISSHPEALFLMSNGDGWYSCLHPSRGTCRDQLSGNWYDTGLAVAMLLPRGASLWDGASSYKAGPVIARTTLRVMERDGEPLIILGRCYHNNETSLLHLLKCLLERCETEQLAWGMMCHSSVTSPFLDGKLGSVYKTRSFHSATVRGTPFWLPEQHLWPYVDGRHSWEHDLRPQIHRLEANILTPFHMK